MEGTMGRRISKDEAIGAVVFGKQYPPDIVNDRFIPNSISFKDFLPHFFTEQKHFSSKEYQTKVAELFPKFKTKWYQKAPTEKEIEKYFIEEKGHGAMDGANSVPQVEEKLGIKIGGGYKYPNGMSDIEYHAYTMGQIGLYTPFHEPNPNNQKEAYMEAWQELHYPREKILPILQQQYHELVELNPQLKDVKLDVNSPVHLTLFKAGVTYDFPVADINLFIAEHDKGSIALRNRDRMKNELNAIGLNEKDFTWVLSSETIKAIGERLKEKNRENTAEIETAPEKPKNPKEIVTDKLRAWGIEDGTYMLITKDDNLHTRYDGADGPIARSVDGYFEDGAKDIARTGRDAVYGTNNGLIGAYFAEGVYMVSANDKLYNVMYRHAANTSLGVMLSNGEPFVDTDPERAKELNNQWQKSKAPKTPAEKVSNTLSMIARIADEHDTTGKMKEKIFDAYIKDETQMQKIEFWGNVVKEFANQSSKGKEACVQDLSKLGLRVSEDVTENRDNSQYQAVKKRCAEGKNADEALHMAQVCAKRSQPPLSSNDYAIAASR